MAKPKERVLTAFMDRFQVNDTIPAHRDRVVFVLANGKSKNPDEMSFLLVGDKARALASLEGLCAAWRREIMN